MSRPGRRRFSDEVAAGLSALRRGFSLWRSSPRLMLLGAAPALIVGTVFLAAFVALLVALPSLVDWATPFADDWQGALRTVTRVALAAGIVLLVGWALVACYAAATLLVGDPFFEKIAHHVEQMLGDPPAERDESAWAGFVRQTGESLRLAGLGLLLAVSLFLVGLLPLVGTVTAFVVGSVVGGRLLVTELTARALDVRGFDLDDRRRLLAARRARSNTFGTAAYLLFIIPIVSVVAMPSVVAGATILARDLLPDPTPASDDSDSLPGSGTIVPPGGFA